MFVFVAFCLIMSSTGLVVVAATWLAGWCDHDNYQTTDFGRSKKRIVTINTQPSYNAETVMCMSIYIDSIKSTVNTID